MFLKTKLYDNLTFDSNFFRIIKLAPIIRDSYYTDFLVPVDFTDAIFTSCSFYVIIAYLMHFSCSLINMTFSMWIWLMQIFPLSKKHANQGPDVCTFGVVYFYQQRGKVVFFNYSNRQFRIFDCWFNSLKLER